MSFIGNSFTNQSFVPQVDYFNGNASTTAFTLSRNVASVADVQVVIENVPQNPSSAFTVSGNVITFTSAPPSGTNNIYVRYTSPTTQVIKPAQGTVGTTELAGGTVATTADATINGITVGKGGGSAATDTAVGYQALLNDAYGLNTAVGYQAGKTVSGGGTVTAVGYQAGTSVTTGDLTAVGYQAGKACTTPNFNVAVGNNSLPVNTTGPNNTAVGAQSLYSNTTAGGSTAVGYRALYSANRTADVNGYNTAVGYTAGYSQVTGQFNVFIGRDCGYSATGSENTFVGHTSGYYTTSSYNTFIGRQAGYLVTTGAKNTILGSYSGNQNGLDFRASTNAIVVSDGDGNPKLYHDGGVTWQIAGSAASNLNSVNVDNAQMYGYPDNTFKCGYPSYRWTAVYAVNGTIQTSDATQKQQIRSLNETEKAVATRIKGLIKTFKWNSSVAEKGDEARIHVGVIAQEVAAAFESEGLDPNRYGMFCSDSWYAVDGDAGKPSEPYTADTEGAVLVTQLGVRYDQLLAFVISAL